MIVAFDSNICLYMLDPRETIKPRQAAKLLLELHRGDDQCLLLWQVLVETTAQLTKWSRQILVNPDVARVISTKLRNLYTLVMPSHKTIDTALTFVDRRALSYWDGLLIAACIEAGVERLYTEDMGAPRQIESVELVNPFKP